MKDKLAIRAAATAHRRGEKVRTGAQDSTPPRAITVAVVETPNGLGLALVTDLASFKLSFAKLVGPHPEYLQAIWEITQSEEGNVIGLKFVPWLTDEQQMGVQSYARVLGYALAELTGHRAICDEALVERGQWLHPPLAAKDLHCFRETAAAIKAWLEEEDCDTSIGAPDRENGGAR